LLLIGRRIDAARAELLEATKAREAIDRLRQKQYDRWRQEQDRREARELDELGTQRFVRQQRVDVA
jgi:flagellar export protein FliJ